MIEVTEQTQNAAEDRVLRVYEELVGLTETLEVNELDPKPAEKAAKALEPLAKKAKKRIDEELDARAEYFRSLSVGASAMDALRIENEELKKRLAASTTEQS